VISSMISLYYYLGVVVVMFMKEAELKVEQTAWLPAVSIGLLVAVIGTIGLGLFPSKLLSSFQQLIAHLI